jgi:tetratricopeptide (TPR) repeat protein
MADESFQDPASSPRSRWGDIWQLPVLLLGLAMLGLGLILVLRTPAPKNDFTGAMDDVARAIHLNDFEKAARGLNHIRHHLEEATPAEQARFDLLSGDLIAQQIQVSPYEYDTPENHQRVIEHYQAADKQGGELDNHRLRRWVMTLVTLGQEREALIMLDRFGHDGHASRYQLLREMIERRLSASPGDVTGVTHLLEQFTAEVRRETDDHARREQEIWASRVQTDMLLAAGDYQRGIDTLLRQMAHFRAQGSDDAQMLPLMVRLAQAYQQSDELVKAEQWYRTAAGLLRDDSASPLNGQVLVGLGQVVLAQSGDARQALDYFSQAQIAYPQSPAFFDALLGRGHCEATLGSHPQAMEHFKHAVELIVEKKPGFEARRKALTSMVHEHYQLCFDTHDYERALEYLNLLLPLHEERLPREMLADLALAHQKIGEQKMERGQAMAPMAPVDGPDAPDAIDARRLTFKQAAISFGKSADYYYEFARLVSAVDDDAYGSSLWSAAINYERAQMWKRAIEVYAQYVQTRGGDPLQLRAQHHLGMAYLADGQYSHAAKLLAELIENHPRSSEAYSSLVPLARAYSRMNKVDDALRVLRHVVSDHPTITRQSEEYRLALIDLGKLLYQQGDYPSAITYLTEALERYEHTADGPGLRFRLADAYRQSVAELDRQLAEPINSTARAARIAERRDRLTRAQVLYSQVVSQMEAMDPQQLTALDKLFHRNAYFYRADCAYDLGQFEQAIALYDLAAKRWDKDPSSLVALVQIVNANCELNRIQAARVANARARERLKEIPEEAFNDATIPMTRKHWEEWLKWSSQLDLFGPQASR